MRKLDLLVPCYNEDDDMIKPLLDSVMVQRGIDLSQVGVIVCCDGGSMRVSDKTIARYPFHIEFHMCEHRGVSATRNACLDLSEAEYCAFCDVDDCLMDSRGLFLVFREMDIDPDPRKLMAQGISTQDAGTGFDFLISDFIEEVRNPETGKTDYRPHSGVNNMTFVHGQVFRRQWLVDNGIRFCDRLNGCHEDSYFISLARAILRPWRGRVNQFPYYLWAWNSASTCRKDPLYLQKTYRDMLDSAQAVIDGLTCRGMQEEAMTRAVAMIEETFYTLNKRSWRSVNNAEYRQAVLERFKEFYRANRDRWHSMPEQQKMMVAKSVSDRCLMEGDMLEAPITMRQWLVRLGLEDDSYIADSKTYL